jgi:hypothetical protein
MEVGDLVRVYNFTRKAREKFRMQGIYQKESRAYFVGLIVKSRIEYGRTRTVLRCVDGEVESYDIDRLEVLNAAR